MTTRVRLFSGIQPTGTIHLGNYVGAIRNWMALTKTHDCLFSIVDYHALTIAPSAEELWERTRHVATVLIACGLSSDQCILFVQSSISAHTELGWILSTLAPVGMLERMTQFKDKADQQRENVNAGLFTYPVLQTADIALYQAAAVPVGEDQVQHLEFARELVRKFNNRYGNTFVEPQALLSTAPRLMGIDGQAKMSKSKNNVIPLLDSEEELWKKLSVAATDPARKRRTDPGNPDICNIMTLHRVFTPEPQRLQCDTGCRTAAIGCLDCKRVLFEPMNRELAPIRTRYAELDSQPDQVDRELRSGAERAREIADKTIATVYERIGISGWR